MCRHGDTLINIFSYQWHVARWAAASFLGGGGRNNAAQQQISRAFKCECLRVIATICICRKNLRGESVLSDLSHVGANHCEHCKD